MGHNNNNNTKKGMEEKTMKKLLIAVMVIGLALCISNQAYASIQIGDGILEWLDDEGAVVFKEDGVGRHGYVGPGYGGQAFDVEILGLMNRGDRLYFGLQTGFDVLNGVQGVDAGDLALDLGDGNSWSTALSFTSENSYALYSDLNYIMGSTTDDWDNPYLHWAETRYMPLSVNNNSKLVGSYNALSLSEVTDLDGNNTFLWEGYLDASALGLSSFNDVDAYWMMSCGNDYGRVDDASPVVPEPGTMVLLGVSMISMAYLRKKKL